MVAARPRVSHCPPGYWAAPLPPHIHLGGLAFRRAGNRSSLPPVVDRRLNSLTYPFRFLLAALFTVDHTLGQTSAPRTDLPAAGPRSSVHLGRPSDRLASSPASNPVASRVTATHLGGAAAAYSVATVPLASSVAARPMAMCAVMVRSASWVTPARSTRRDDMRYGAGPVATRALTVREAVLRLQRRRYRCEASLPTHRCATPYNAYCFTFCRCGIRVG